MVSVTVDGGAPTPLVEKESSNAMSARYSPEGDRIAFVSLATAGAPTPAEIGARVKPRLGIKTPKRIEVVPALPKTANGKVDKRALRERLAAGAA